VITCVSTNELLVVISLHRMHSVGLIVTHVTRSVVCVSVSVLFTLMYFAKMA